MHQFYQIAHEIKLGFVLAAKYQEFALLNLLRAE